MSRESFKSILDMEEKEARSFFLEEKSYFNMDLPKYFNFDRILKDTEKKLEEYSYDSNKCNISSLMKNGNREVRSLQPNYKIFANKDGELDWRPYQLIHPWLYYYLVTIVTEKNNWNEIKQILKSRKNNYKNIQCISIPKKSLTKKNDKEETILNWWEEIEQQTIALAIDYEYCLHLDIANCYGSIYTHTISWAIHGKTIAKENKQKGEFLGNLIDEEIQNMNEGQTNGIPQGSILMDFIAEIVLSYSDELLGKKLIEEKIEDYKILRYRDDYRIFSNSITEIKKISKYLSEELLKLNFKLNSNKTLLTDNVILEGIKPGKLEYQKLKTALISLDPDIEYKGFDLNIKYSYSIQKYLLEILIFSKKYKNSTRISVALKDLYEIRIKRLTEIPKDFKQIISIITEIIMKNPNTIGMGVAILSKLLSFLKEKDNNEEIFSYINKLVKKIRSIPNTEYLEIWLQRMTIKLDRNMEYSTALCNKIRNKKIKIFNSDWISSKKIRFDETILIDEKEIDTVSEIISIEEVSIFNY